MLEEFVLALRVGAGPVVSGIVSGDQCEGERGVQVDSNVSSASMG
jgi:hypothetical protein